jgi:hypothetical protein
MSNNEHLSGLPIAFLRTIVAEARPDTPPVRMALEKVRSMPSGESRDNLLLDLLRGALSRSAPGWLLEAAVDSELSKARSPYPGAPMPLVAAVLPHPACSDELREKTLRRCSPPQLGSLGHSGCNAVLAKAIAAELRHREPQEQPMTPALLKEPGAAQVILQQTDLHDEVFAAALELLPIHPARALKKGELDDPDAWFKQYMAASDAWSDMWKKIVTTHPRRHRQLVVQAPDTGTRNTVRAHLLGTCPWDVEPSLLEETAARDLARFRAYELITRIFRMRRDGLSFDESRSRLTLELDALGPEELQQVERFCEHADDMAYGLHAAVSWVESAAAESWRYILNPADAPLSYGVARTWQAPATLLAALGRRFADVAVRALHLWEPGSETLRPRTRQLRWIHAMLLHLPDITEEVKEKTRAVVRHLQPGGNVRWSHTGHDGYQEEQELNRLRVAIERILADSSSTSRQSALGDPKDVTARDLSAATDEVLQEYLDRHADDGLIEKALLSFAWRSHRQGISFSDVLARHSAPEEALVQITKDLRRRLGGGPNLREAWASKVLKLPNHTPDLVRALPAWTALTVGGSAYGTACAAVASTVLTALGDDDEAWSRFATSPASYAGPNAWLRLGEVLDAAATGAEWPKPPSSR